MIYPLLKGLHILGAFLFVGGLFALPVEGWMYQQAGKSYSLKNNLWHRTALVGLLMAILAGVSLFFVGGYGLKADWLGLGILLSGVMIVAWHPLLMGKSSEFSPGKFQSSLLLLGLSLGIVYLMSSKPF
jgi:hypothetical protein